jgi:FkbM family methyltransferase
MVQRSLPRLRRFAGDSSVFCLPGDHIGDSIFLDGLYEGSLLHATFEKLLPDYAETFRRGICLDVGANIGNHTLFFASRFMQVLAFEPNPVLCLALRASLALYRAENVQLHEVGLGAANECLPYVQESGNLGHSRFVDPEGAPADCRWLELRVGDELVEAAGIDQVAMIKIDVEGHEHPVLQGLERTLRHSNPLILFEAHPEVNRGEAETTIAYLKGLGFEHLYTCERQRISPHASTLRKTLFRLRHGYEERPVAVTELEEREYLMLVASRRRLRLERAAVPVEIDPALLDADGAEAKLRPEGGAARRR